MDRTLPQRHDCNNARKGELRAFARTTTAYRSYRYTYHRQMVCCRQLPIACHARTDNVSATPAPTARQQCTRASVHTSEQLAPNSHRGARFTQPAAPLSPRAHTPTTAECRTRTQSTNSCFVAPCGRRPGVAPYGTERHRVACAAPYARVAYMTCLTALSRTYVMAPVGTPCVVQSQGGAQCPQCAMARVAVGVAEQQRTQTQGREHSACSTGACEVVLAKLMPTSQRTDSGYQQEYIRRNARCPQAGKLDCILSPQHRCSRLGA